MFFQKLLSKLAVSVYICQFFNHITCNIEYSTFVKKLNLKPRFFPQNLLKLAANENLVAVTTLLKTNDSAAEANKTKHVIMCVHHWSLWHRIPQFIPAVG